METSAFVRPGRRTVFMTHVHCVSAAVARAVLGVYGAAERVPAAAEVGTERASEARTLLEQRAELYR